MNRTLFHIKYLITIILLAFSSFMSVAQDADAPQDPDEEYTATSGDETYSSYEKRYFDRKRLQELKNQPEFQYDKTIDPQTQNIREISDQEFFSDTSRRKRSNAEQGGTGNSRSGSSKSSSEQQKEQKRNQSSQSAPVSISWPLVLIIFAVLVVLLMMALKLKPGSLFSRSGAKDIEEQQEHKEDIHKMQFESELDKAIRMQNYRMALRIMYLETLKKMTDRNIINWQPEKTNWDFVREVNEPSLKVPFTEITNAYDYAWYGEFAIDEPLFRMMQDKMLRFRKIMGS